MRSLPVSAKPDSHELPMGSCIKYLLMVGITQGKR
uniref:Uncharacterized protein n=1 Tax=Arundo donax TaxID=35708 RepID=A0A0A9H922_ARUDO